MEGDKTLSAALKKRARGYTAKECVEEYAMVDGKLEVVKRKVVKKEIPPDVAAIKALLGGGAELASLTDEELNAERERLTNIWREKYGAD